MNHIFDSFCIQKKHLEQQLSELANLFDGYDNPAVAKEIANLEVQKAEISSKLTRLNSEIECTKTEISIISEKISKCSEGLTHRLLNIISTQRIFYIKNKPRLFLIPTLGAYFQILSI